MAIYLGFRIDIRLVGLLVQICLHDVLDRRLTGIRQVAQACICFPCQIRVQAADLAIYLGFRIDIRLVGLLVQIRLHDIFDRCFAGIRQVAQARICFPS